MSVDFSNEADVIEVVVPGQTQVITLAVPGLQGPPGKLVVGTVTTGNPGTSAAVSAVDNAQGQQVVNFTIPRGDVGAPNSLAIGTVTTAAAGVNAAASITGTAPNQTLNLTLPRGATGAAALMTIGTVTTGAPGTSASASITGTPPNYVLNLTIPRGDVGTVNAHTHVSADVTDATNLATGNTLVKRDAGGNANFTSVDIGTTTNAGHAARKDYVDGIGSALSGVNTIVRRDGNASSQFADVNIINTPASASNATRKDYVDAQVATRAPTSHTHTAVNISDSTATGRSVLTAVDAAAARTAIGAGTSSLAIGTTSTTAKAGDYQPTAANISDATTIGRTVLTSVDAAAVRTAIGAGTSNLAIGTTSTTAKAGDYTPPSDGAAGVATMRTLGTGATQAAAGNDARLSDARTPTAHTHTATNISDSTATGRSVLMAVDAAAARTAIGAGTSSLVIGTTAGTAAAGNDSRLSDARTPTAHTHTAANINDSTAVGRAVLTAVDAAAARAAIGADSGGAAVVRQHDGTTVAVRPNTTAPVHWIVPFTFTLPLNGTTAGGTIAAVDNLDLVSRY